MAAGDTMPGRRVEGKQPHELKPGDYVRRTREGGAATWYACTPSGAVGNLDQHDITEHDDGTITAAPSILVEIPRTFQSWHGYLERGVWREV